MGDACFTPYRNNNRVSVHACHPPGKPTPLDQVQRSTVICSPASSLSSTEGVKRNILNRQISHANAGKYSSKRRTNISSPDGQVVRRVTCNDEIRGSIPRRGFEMFFGGSLSVCDECVAEGDCNCL